MKSKYQTLLLLSLFLATLNAGYLSYRFLIVHAHPDLIGSSICSLTDTIDCDKVLNSPQARAFFVPNAILGFSFYLASLLWVVIGFRMENEARKTILMLLWYFLLLATALTFVFWWLLLHLDFFCVLCPLNHLLVYVSLFATYQLLKKEPPMASSFQGQKLMLLGVGCAVLFLGLNLGWCLLFDFTDWDLAEVWQLAN